MIDGSYTVTVLAAYSQHLTSRFATNFIYLVFALLRLYVLIAKICETQELANSGVLHLHEIWNQHVSRKEMNREFRHLELLSIRMLNTQMEFSIRGFFNLDWTFFQTVKMGFEWREKNCFLCFSDGCCFYHLLAYSRSVSNLVHLIRTMCVHIQVRSTKIKRFF